MDKILITTHEATTLDQMAKDSAERWEKEKQLDEILKNYYEKSSLTFNECIKCMEVAKHFNCHDTVEFILNEIKDEHSLMWQIYLQSTNK